MLRETCKSKADNKYYFRLPIRLKNSAQTEQTVQRILEFTALAVWFASFFIVLCALT